MKKLTTTTLAVIIAIIIILAGGVYITYREVAKSSIFYGVTESDEAVMIFLKMMIPHHAEAVSLSKDIMTDVTITVPEVRLLAGRIVDAQEFEVAKMKGWYMDWFAVPYMPTLMIGGNMNTDSASSVKKGDEGAKVYLRNMIKHHENAIRSARDARELIEKIEKSHSTTDGVITIMNSHPGIDTTLVFTKQIEEVQAKEILEMKELLKKF